VSIERRAAASSTRSQTLYGRSPLSFERNVGQADPEVKFLSRGAGFAVFLADCEAVVMLTAFAGRHTADALRLQTRTDNTVHFLKPIAYEMARIHDSLTRGGKVNSSPWLTLKRL
jgi:hypothetical protein